jgi:UDP-GlcNAc:undecaprenyl-phosphate GlcNAc-1-phosphate transferase
MRDYALPLLITVTVTYLLTPLVRRLAIKVGAVFAARDRDVHAAPIPRMGGLAMFAGAAAGLLAAGRLAAPGGVISTRDLLLLLLAAGLIVGVGLVDDRFGINPGVKLIGQIAAAAILFVGGAKLQFFPLPNEAVFDLTPNESLVLTIVVVVATINAVNFIDGLDGLAAGIVCIAAISFFVYYYYLTQSVGLVPELAPALASVVLAGACLGFLPHNFYPAKIFMGDTGSMLLGLLLAYVPIQAMSSAPFTILANANKANRFAEVLPLLLPAVVLVIPYTDMLRAVIRRTRAGQSPFAADRKHLHHRMLEIGHSHRSSVLILYAWAAVFAGTVVGLSIVTVSLVYLALTTLAAVLVLVLLSIPAMRFWERGSRAGAPAAQPGGTPAAQPGGTPAASGRFRHGG